MSSTPDSVRDEAASVGVRVGRPVQASTGLPGTASTMIYSDSNKLVATGAVPFAIPITPSASTVTFLSATGTATSDVMTTNLVVDGAGGATTFTKKAYLKVSVTDSGGVATNGDYYIQIGTLS